DGEPYLAPPVLSAWSSQTLELTATGVQASNPLGFTELGKDYGYVLYNHQLEADTAGETTLALSALQDTARVFVNGKEEGLIKDVGAGSVKVSLKQGQNDIQFLVQQMGRLNFSPYLG